LGELDLVEDRQERLEDVVRRADLDVRPVAVDAPLVVDVLRLQPLQVREALGREDRVRVLLPGLVRSDGDLLLAPGGGGPGVDHRARLLVGRCLDVDLLLGLRDGGIRVRGRLGVDGLVRVGHLFSSASASSTTSASTMSSSPSPEPWSAPGSPPGVSPPAWPSSAEAAYRAAPIFWDSSLSVSTFVFRSSTLTSDSGLRASLRSASASSTGLRCSSVSFSPDSPRNFSVE